MPLNAYENQYENKQTAFNPYLSKKILHTTQLNKIIAVKVAQYSRRASCSNCLYQGRFSPQEYLYFHGKRFVKNFVCEGKSSQVCENINFVPYRKQIS